MLKLTLTGSFIFSLFAMQTKGANFANAVTYGRAAYIATGRGFQMDTISVVKLYSDYVETHIYFSFEVAVYLTLIAAFSTYTTGTLVLTVWPTWLVVVSLM